LHVFDARLQRAARDLETRVEVAQLDVGARDVGRASSASVARRMRPKKSSSQKTVPAAARTAPSLSVPGGSAGRLVSLTRTRAAEACKSTRG
jgi:hypothetical protein